MLGGHGEEVRESKDIAPALQRAREAIASSGKSAVVNIWVDPREYAPRHPQPDHVQVVSISVQETTSQ